jgi:hypothetical protein
MALLARTVSVALVGLTASSVACVIGEERFERITLPARIAPKSRTCSSPDVKPDLSKLKACGEGKGKGHCYDASKLEVFPKEELTPCEGDEHCVPDKILLAGGKKVKSCTFRMPGDDTDPGKPGACHSVLVKQIGQNKDLLKPDVCDPDERCTPCIHPLQKVDTHVCDEMGVHESACVDGKADGGLAEECCWGAGVCSFKDGLPADSRDFLAPQGCPSGKVCAPAALVEGTPRKCSGILGVSGVCVPICFVTQLSTTTEVTQGDCQALEICLPCVIGKSQGMPGCE